MGGLTTWAAFPGTDLYTTEVRWYGIPLLVATFGAIVHGLVRTPRATASRLRHRAGAVRDRGGGLPDPDLRHRGAKLGRHAFRAHRGGLRRDGRVRADPRTHAAGGGPGAGHHHRGLPGLHLHRASPARHPRGADALYLAALLRLRLHRCGHPWPTTAVSSTYIILFIIFAAFLQASKVGDYFVNFAFAAAGRARGGPAKVAIFASGLMGMINGTSAGNVVATGSLTIPLMKKRGLPQADRGRGRGRGVDRRADHAADHGRGRLHHGRDHRHPLYRDRHRGDHPGDPLLRRRSTSWWTSRPPSSACAGCARTSCRSSATWRRVFLFLPIVILIAALFMGYSVIRAGTLGNGGRGRSSAGPCRTFPHRMGPHRALPVVLLTIAHRHAVAHRVAPDRRLRALELMSIQIIAVCACAGIIVGVISLTGVGARFSSVLLDLAGVAS
jgi:hypothetical protein